MGLIEHAEYELRLAGYDIDADYDNIDSEKDYANRIGQSALELIRLFAKQGHSGFSAIVTMKIFNRLVNHKPLTNELSNNPDEWQDMSEQNGYATWQSKRNCSCFSHDMKTYYDIDDPENNVYEKDEKGNLTGFMQLKPLSQRKMIEMVKYES